MSKEPIDMRDAFFDKLYDIAKNDRDVIFLTADMGAFSLVRFKKDLEKQYINVGVAEQNMVSVAAGLALSGKKVYIYSIVPFVTQRCYEQIKIDLSLMNIPVTIIGSGPGFSYNSDGPTHHASQDIANIRTLPNMTILSPSDSEMAKGFASLSYKHNGPTYIRLDKGKYPSLYKKKDYSQGFGFIKKGQNLTIITTGIIIHKVLHVCEELKKNSIEANIIDIYRLKPLNKKVLLKILKDSKNIVTVEESSIVGGLGSIISELLADNDLQIPLKRIGSPDEYCYLYSNRDCIHTKYGLDATGITENILGWIK